MVSGEGEKQVDSRHVLGGKNASHDRKEGVIRGVLSNAVTSHFELNGSQVPYTVNMKERELSTVRFTIWKM